MIFIYSNIFDTVRNRDEDLFYLEGMLYTSILNGFHPVFALSQAVDSKGIHSIMKNEAFCRLMRNGIINVALYGKYKPRYTVITDYLQDKLNQCIVENEPSFRFSSMEFLYENDKYEQKQLLTLYKTMLGTLDDIPRNFNGKSLYKIGISQDDADKIQDYLETIEHLEEIFWGRYIPAPDDNTRKTSLYRRLKRSMYISLTDIEANESEIYAALTDLMRNCEREEENEWRLNSRSYLYKRYIILK